MSEDTKKCPFCAETIRAEAIVCRYCGRDLPPIINDDVQSASHQDDNVTKQAEAQSEMPKKKKGSKAIYLFIGIAFLCVCSLFIGLASSRNRQEENAETANQEISREQTPTPKSTNTLTPNATNTFTPEPTTASISNFSFSDIIQHRDEKGWTSTQYDTYFDTINNRRVSGWVGTVLEVDESLGRPYLSLDMEPGEPKIDVYIYINEDDVLKVGLGQSVEFEGTIDGKWPESNGFYALEIKDVTLLELSEIPTPTPAPPTPTPGPTSTPTPDIGGEIEAEVMCQNFVEDRLKSPSSADFGGLFDDRDKAVFVDAETADDFGVDTSTLRNTGVWVVVGQVDAENSFGATIRSEYTCVMDYDKNSKNWYLLDISIEER